MSEEGRSRLVAKLSDLYRNGPSKTWRDDVRDAAEEMDYMLLELRQGLEAGTAIEGHRNRLMRENDQLRELCAFLIDACATHRIPVPLNSSLLDLAADIASDGGAAAVGSETPDGGGDVCPDCGDPDAEMVAVGYDPTTGSVIAECSCQHWSDRCPTCGSDDPAMQRVRGPGQRHCPDPWHSPDPDMGPA